jgi:hypothetical protein
MMTKKALRTVQPAHKSDRVTVAQAKAAWLKVEGRCPQPQEGSVSSQASDRESEHPRSGKRS